MTPAEMQALWKEVQQAQAGHPPLPISGVEDIPKSVANGIPTPPTAASQLPIPGAIPNGVPDNFLMPRKSQSTSNDITQNYFNQNISCKKNQKKQKLLQLVGCCPRTKRLKPKSKKKTAQIKPTHSTDMVSANGPVVMGLVTHLMRL